MLIDAAGGVPDPYASMGQAARYRHEDLLDLTDEELEAERIMVGIAWAAIMRERWLSADRELEWFSIRRAKLASEQGRRQRR